MLEPYRVLDLTDEKGLFCGKVLADLGADVVQVEPPAGNGARTLPPFLGDKPGIERSLYWLAYSAGKRSITLNLETEPGRALFRRLCQKADFIVESLPVGYLAGVGLSHLSLKQANPGLIMASITPFGQTGPYHNFKGSDLITSAMGGMVYCTGDPDRAPLRISVDQAYCQASLHAAIGMLIALQERALSGQGQRVDVSIQAAMVRTLHTQLPYWEYSRHVVKRAGPFRFRGGAATREVWPCKDGFVAWMFFGGGVGTQQMQVMVKWLESNGMAGPLSSAVEDWAAVDLTKVPPETIRSWEQVIGDFFLAHTKQELYEEALERRVPLTPVNSISEVVTDKQLAARDFWTDVDYPELGRSLQYPGALFRSSEPEYTPGVKRRAPMLGEHNEAVYVGELGMSRDEVASLHQEGVL